MNNRQKIIITGANGQLGHELLQISKLFPDFDFVFLTRDELDISNPEKVRALFEKEQPQYMVNCAAYTAVDRAEEEKELAFEINGNAVGLLATTARQYKSLFLHISSDYVFDGKAQQPYKESDPVEPQSVYGASKLKGEQLAISNNPDAIIIRSSWIYSSFGKNFVKTMLKLMSEKKEITVVNDQVGSPTYAADLAELIMHIISSRQWHPGIYHFSNEGAITWFHFASAIRDLIKAETIVNPIPTSSYPTPATRPAYSVLDKTKLQETYHITLKPWKLSLRECISKIELERGVN